LLTQKNDKDHITKFAEELKKADQTNGIRNLPGQMTWVKGFKELIKSIF